MESIEIARLCAKYADDKKAGDIQLLDLRGLSPVTDFFVICTATSNPHLRAVRDEIVEQMRDEQGQKPLLSDGTHESQWLIVNYPNVLVHILSPEKREYYALEQLWGDAPRLEWQSTEPPPPPPERKRTVKSTVKKPAAKKAAAPKTAAKKAAAKKAPRSRG